jgi:rhomboid family GlyGly-CTERM serine protease
MIYFNSRSKPGWLFIAVMLAIMTVFQFLDIRDLRYQTNWWSAGEYWRGYTAHWVHANWWHFLLNAAGMILCMTLASPTWSIRRWIAYHLCLALGISILFTLLNPELRWYVGYSGVLFGIYLLAAIDLYSRDKTIALLIGAAIVIKVVLEQSSDINVTSGNLIGIPVIIDAHLYGLLLGLSIALAQRVYTIWDKRNNANLSS